MPKNEDAEDHAQFPEPKTMSRDSGTAARVERLCIRKGYQGHMALRALGAAHRELDPCAIRESQRLLEEWDPELAQDPEAAGQIAMRGILAARFLVVKAGVGVAAPSLVLRERVPTPPRWPTRPTSAVQRLPNNDGHG